MMLDTGYLKLEERMLGVERPLTCTGNDMSCLGSGAEHQVSSFKYPVSAQYLASVCHFSGLCDECVKLWAQLVDYFFVVCRFLLRHNASTDSLPEPGFRFFEGAPRIHIELSSVSMSEASVPLGKVGSNAVSRSDDLVTDRFLSLFRPAIKSMPNQVRQFFSQFINVHLVDLSHDGDSSFLRLARSIGDSRIKFQESSIIL